MLGITSQNQQSMEFLLSALLGGLPLARHKGYLQLGFPTVGSSICLKS